MSLGPFLAMLLSLAAGAEESSFGATGGIDFSAVRRMGRAPSHAAPAPAAGEAAPVPATDAAARIRAAHAELTDAAVPVAVVIEMGERKMGWTVTNMADFAGVIPAASRATAALHASNPDAVAEFYRGRCIAAGTLTNLNGTIRGDLNRGCIAHQQAVFGPARAAAGSSLEVKKIRYGLFPQHNAVIVFPRGTDWRYTGIVLDGWKCQTSEPRRMVYLYENWGGARPIELFGREWEINPNPGSAMPRLLADHE
ncbi:MAG: hypothetical protein SF051_14360 [Elusimicrobiota bacterium]|nr:hypothetical protein [Elusimicrobiota bacterium]